MYAHRGSIQSVVVLITLFFCLSISSVTKTQAAMTNTMPPASAGRLTVQSVDKPLLGRTILIDPGHGGKDPGAGRAGVEEKNITLAVSLLLRGRLQALGANVDLTRAVDEAVPLTVRLTDSNTICPDLFLSVHVNSVRDSHINGIETYYYDGRGQLLARHILDTLALELHQQAKWSHARDLKVLVGNRAPATLAEIGYLTNPAGRAELRDPGYQDKVAGALADSLVGYFANPGSPRGCQL
jgi:N-acetylmuramoyl-L-alanine amidase